MNRKLHSLKNRTLAALSLSAILMVLCSAAWAQQISDKVVADDGEALPGVNRDRHGCEWRI
jgi:hypothetical protein